MNVEGFKHPDKIERTVMINGDRSDNINIPGYLSK